MSASWRALQWSTTGIVLLVTAAIAFFTLLPATRPTCGRIASTGQACAACGLTRTLHASLTGTEPTGLAPHPAAPWLLGLLLLQLALRAPALRAQRPCWVLFDLGQWFALWALWAVVHFGWPW